MDRFGLKQRDIQKMNDVFNHYPQVESVILYGSRAKGTHRNGSDIDLTMKGEGLDLTIQFRIEHELDDLLLPYKIDLSILNQISNPDLVDHVQRVGQVFYSK